MSTITLPNIRVSSDLTVKVRLKDGGVAVDWSTLSRLKAFIYSDDQQAIAGRCAVSIDGDDHTLLVCQYSANKSQYLGVNRIIVSASYMSETKTYDKPALNFVRWTDDQEGEQITISDPDVEVEIEVEDISSSILQEAVDAAFSAAERAEDAAEAAEHMVDIHTGPEGKSAYEVAVDEGYTGTEEEWLASLKGDTGETPNITIGTVTTVEPGTPAAATMTGTPEAPVLNLTIPKGAVGDTPNFTVGEVTTGQPGTPVVVTITGTAAAPVLNITIPQGMQGNTGSSVDYPYELVNNLTTNDATKGLSAAQGKVLKDEITQLDLKVDELEAKTTELDINISSAYGGTIPYPFKAGETYIVYSQQATAVNVSTRNTPSSSTIDGTFSVPGNGQKEFTTTADASYLRVSSAFVGLIFVKDSTAHKVYLQGIQNNTQDTQIAAIISEKDGNNRSEDVIGHSRVYPWTYGKFYNVNLQETTSSGWCYSPPIAVNKGDVVSLNTVGACVSLVCKSDSLGVVSESLLSSPVDASATVPAEYSYVIPEDTYIVICYKYTIPGAFYAINGLYDKARELDFAVNGKALLAGAYGLKSLFVFYAGQTYVVYSEQATAVTVSTRDSANGDAVDGPFTVPGNGSVEFTTTASASYLRVSATFVGWIFVKGSVAEQLYLLKKNGVSIGTRVTALENNVLNKVSKKVGKNLFDKDSPLLRDNSIFNQDGSIRSDQYSIYWLISNPIDVSGHQGGKIICNKSYDTTNRYACFEDAEGNKTTVLTSVEAYTIPADAVTAYIPVYKESGSVNLNEVQIEFGAASSDYEPYNPLGGYFKEEVSDETVFPPSPQPDKHETYPSINTAFIYNVFDSWVAKFPTYVVKTNLGRDASNTFDVNGYKIAFATNPVYKIMFICNQHGGSANGDPVMGAYIATQFINDICGSGHRHNDRLKWIRNNVEIYIIPAANPWGIDNKRRVNYNGVNLNRNWPTSGWDDEPTGQGTDDYKGASAADQPELQHYLQYISDVQPDIIIDNHTLGGTDGSTDANSGIMYIGFNKDAVEDSDAYSAFISALRSVMQKEYGITPTAYGHTTATTPDCRVWCSENDYYGGLIEMQWRDPLESEAGFTPSIIEASYMLCLSIYQYYATKE